MNLADALDDIVERLLLDDWELLLDHAPDDPSQWYYVLGIDAFYKHQSDMDVPPRAEKWSPRPGLVKYLRALIGAPQSDYVRTALKRFRELGIRTKEEAFELTRKIITDEVYSESQESPSPEIEEAAVALFDALRVEGQAVEDPPHEYLRGELERARQKQYLRELSFKYRSLQSKLERLNPLQFSDPRLQEATRCWLYGFYRATIILSAIALENVLKDRTGIARIETYKELVDAAEQIGVISPPYSEQARGVFRRRNNVVHEAPDPDSNEAEDVLVWVRGILAELHSPNAS